MPAHDHACFPVFRDFVHGHVVNPAACLCVFSDALLISLLFATSSGSLAQEAPRQCPASQYSSEERSEMGWKGSLTIQCAKELERSKPLAHGDDLWITGYKIDSDEVKTYLTSIRRPLRISNSVVERGLFVEIARTPQNENDRKLLPSAPAKLDPSLARRFPSVSILDSELRPNISGFAFQAGNVIFDSIVIRRTLFKGVVALENIVVSNLEVSQSIFEKTLSLRESELRGKGIHYFQNIRFDDGVILERAHVEGCIQFVKVEVSGDLDLDEAHLDQCGRLPLFPGSTFKGEAHLQMTRFGEHAAFGDPVFTKDVQLYGMRVGGSLVFNSSTFEGVASLRDIVVTQDISMGRATIRRLLDLRGATAQRISWDNTGALHRVPGIVDMRRVHTCELMFSNVLFDDRVDLGGLEPLQGKEDCPRVLMRSVTFRDAAIFLDAKMTGYVEFADVDFAKEADFRDAIFKLYDAKSQPTFHFSNVRFGKLSLRWAQLPAQALWSEQPKALPPKPGFPAYYQQASVLRTLKPSARQDALQALEAGFLAQGNLDDANRARYHLEAARLNEKTMKAGSLEGLQLWITKAMWGIPTGFGRDIERALLWAVVLWIAFAAVYAVAGRVHHALPDPKSDDDKIRLHLLDVPSTFVEESPPPSSEKGRIANALQLSFLLLLKVGRRDLRASADGPRFGVRRVVYFQWLLGYYVLAALLVTLANTQPLFNGLIRALF